MRGTRKEDETRVTILIVDMKKKEPCSPKSFKERCHKCGKFGHKAVDYRSEGKKGPWTPSHNGGV